MTESVAYYPPETRVMPLTLIRRERLLPTPGKVLVSMQERLQATQIVAQADVTGEVRIVNIARALRVPTAKAFRYLKVKEGDDVKAGAVLAARGLLSGARAVSPVDGFVSRVDKNTGRVLIQVVAKPFELNAYLPGTVINVMAARGVVIEATGALIQGTVGFGGESFGVLTSRPASRPMYCAQDRSIFRRMARSSSAARGSMNLRCSKARSCKCAASLPAAWKVACWKWRAAWRSRSF
jgi:hypothetical protein